MPDRHCDSSAASFPRNDSALPVPCSLFPLPAFSPPGDRLPPPDGQCRVQQLSQTGPAQIGGSPERDVAMHLAASFEQLSGIGKGSSTDEAQLHAAFAEDQVQTMSL